MSTVTCTFDGVVGAEIIWAIAEGSNVYIFYVSGTDLLCKRYNIEPNVDAITIATAITAVAQ